jgi:hypothetical protein
VVVRHVPVHEQDLDERPGACRVAVGLAHRGPPRLMDGVNLLRVIELGSEHDLEVSTAIDREAQAAPTS